MSFELYHHDLKFFMQETQVFLIICNVEHIFPEPNLSLV